MCWQKCIAWSISLLLVAGWSGPSARGENPDWLPEQYGVPHQTPVPASEASLTMYELSQRLDAIEASLKNDKSEDNPWQDVSSQGWSVKVFGRAHGDYTLIADQDAGNRARFGSEENLFEFRRLRLGAEGTGYGVYGYKIEFDFAPEGETLIRDAFFDLKEIPLLGTVRIGNYKEPFSLEELTSSNNITFIERALPNVFAPSRNVGITAYNSNPQETLIWAYGIFFDAIDQAAHFERDDNQGPQLVSRLVALPYYCDDGRYLVHLGVAGLWVNDRDDTVRWRQRPEARTENRFIDTGEFAADWYSALNLEAAMNWGPLSLQSEYFFNHSSGTLGEPDRDFHGAYTFVSYFLTGEHRAYRRSAAAFDRVRPYTNFWIVRGPAGIDYGWGAWEVMARWSYLDLVDGPDDNAGEMHDLTLGLNWYWNPNIKYKLNWIHSFNRYNEPVDGFTRGEADIISMRMQFDF